MRIENWLKVSFVATGLVCLAGLPAVTRAQSQDSQQTGDSVADAARRAREQQKTQPKPKKVFTDDDIKPSTASTESGSNANQASSNAAGTASGKGAAASSAEVSASSSGKDDAESTWRKKFHDQRDKIAAAEKELDVMQREMSKTETQYYNDPQKALMEQNSRKDINEKTAKIDEKKQQIANLKQQLSDMEDELRKSGGDPGWARE